MRSDIRPLGPTPHSSYNPGVPTLNEGVTQLEAIAAVSEAMAAADTVGDAVRAALSGLIGVLGYSAAAGLVVNRKGQLVAVADLGRPEPWKGKLRVTVQAPSRVLHGADDRSEPLVAALSDVLEATPSRYVVALTRSDRLHGALLLGDPADPPLEHEQKLFVAIVARSLAYVLEAQGTNAKLHRANRILNARAYSLHTLVELGREMHLAHDVEALYRVLAMAIDGHVGPSRCLVLERREDHFDVVVAPPQCGTDDAQMLAGRDLFMTLAALERPTRTKDLDGLPGFDTFTRLGLTHLVPMRHRERIRGVVAIGFESGAGTPDLDYLAALGAQASVARENLRLRDEALVRQRMERELSIARGIQRSLLPERSPAVDGYDIAARMRTCFEVGGDSYDFIELADGRIAVSVGDVPGKGTPAALLMATVRAILRAVAASTSLDPAGLLTAVNRLVLDVTRGENFVTFVYAVLDPSAHTLTVANAGHCYPLLIRAGGGVEALDESGLVLGLSASASYENRTARLDEGDTVLLFTDGLTEAEDSRGQPFGERLVEALAARSWASSSRGLVEGLFATLDAFADGPARDDTTIVAMRRRPPGPR